MKTNTRWILTGVSAIALSAPAFAQDTTIVLRMTSC